MTKKLYIDQCALSTMCHNAGIPWKKTKLGNVIYKLIQEGHVEVWTSPVNVLETFLCADFDDDNRVRDTEKLDRRIRLAQTLLELIDCKRMAPAFEFLVVRQFLDILTKVAPDVVLTCDFFKFAETTNQQVYLGLLAMLAAVRTLDRPEAIDDLLRSKLSNRLLHSRFANDPKKFVDDMVACAKEFRVTTNEIWEAYDNLSLNELQNEIETNLKTARAMDKVTRSRLQKNKKTIAKAYSAAELGQCLASVFHSEAFLQITFDTMALREHWNTILDLPPPKFLTDASEDACKSDVALLLKSLEALIRSLSESCLLYARVPDYVVLGELEIALNKGEIPTGGLGFDCEHATTLCTMDIFLTHDTRLLNLAKRAAKFLQDNETWKVAVVANEVQLNAAATS